MVAKPVDFSDLETEVEIPEIPKAKFQLAPRERDFAIRTVFGEVLNDEPDEGIAGVAHTIRNRVYAGRWGDNVESVVLAPGQFEPWENPEARRRMFGLQESDPRYQRIGQFVDAAFSGRDVDPTDGSTHFFAPKAQSRLGRSVPKWTRGEGRQLGNHAFYKPEGRPVTDVDFDDLLDEPPTGPTQSAKQLSVPPVQNVKTRVTTGGGEEAKTKPVVQPIAKEVTPIDLENVEVGPLDALDQVAIESGRDVVRGVAQFGLGAAKGFVARGHANAIRQLDIINKIDAGEQITPIDDVLGYAAIKESDPDAAARMKLTIEAMARGDITPQDQPEMQALEGAEKKLNKALAPQFPGYNKPSVRRDFFQGGGSMLAGLGLNLIGGPMLAGAGFVAAGAGEAAEKAIKFDEAAKRGNALLAMSGAEGPPQARVTPQQFDVATQGGAVAGATDLTDLLLPGISGPLKQAAQSLVRRIGGPTAKGIALNATQEGFQQLLQNAIALGVYNPAQDVWDEVGYNALIGGMLGGSVGALSGSLSKPILFTTPEDRKLRYQVENEFRARFGGESFVDQTIPNLAAPASISPGQIPAETNVEPGVEVSSRIRTDKSTAVVEPEAEETGTRMVGETAPQVPAQSQPQFSPRRVKTETFYSNLARTIERKGPKIADGDEWMRFIGNSPGITREELEWTGIREFIAKQEGRVTKEDINVYLEDAQITVSDSVLMGEHEGTYVEYAMPGPRDGYGVVMLTLPEAKSVRDIGNEIAEFNRQMNERYGERYVDKMTQDEADALLELYNRQEDVEQETTFTESHFPDPNVIAHVQWSNRTDRDGVRGLLLDAVQSDWMQKGGDRGFQRPGLARAMQRLWQEARELSFDNDFEAREARFAEMLDEAEALDHDALKGHVAVIRGNIARNNYASAYASQGNDFVVALALSRAAVSKQVPDAPFKTSWPELMFKRMMRWAVDNGAQRIYLPPGSFVANYNTGGQVNAEQRKGIKYFYDKVLPSVAKKWAKKLGGRVGETYLARAEYRIRPFTFTNLNRNQETRHRVERSNIETNFDGTPNQAWVPMGDFFTVEDAQKFIDGLQVPVMFVELTPDMSNNVASGLPLFAERDTPGVKLNYKPPFQSKPPLSSNPVTAAEAAKVTKVLEEMIKRFNIKAKVVLEVVPEPFADYGGYLWPKGTHYELRVNSAVFSDIYSFYTTAMHEFGHLVELELFRNASVVEQQAVMKDYQSFVNSVDENTTLGRIWQMQTGAPNYEDRRNTWGTFNQTVAELRKIPHNMANGSTKADYYTSFAEWFADQVSRWATSDAKPIAVAEKVYQRIGQVLYNMFREISARLGMPFRASSAMQDFLNSRMSVGDEFMPQYVREREQRWAQMAQQSIGPGLKAVPPQQGGTVAQKGVNQLFGKNPPAKVRQALALADRLTWVYKYGATIAELARKMPRLIPLQKYVSRIRAMTNDEHTIQDAALRFEKEWHEFGDEGDRIAAFIDELMHMTYLTPQEEALGIRRQPTKQEATAMARRLRVSPKGIMFVSRMQGFFHEFLGKLEYEAYKAAAQISDPAAQAAAVNAIRLRGEELRKAPYFPALRFGTHVVTVYDSKGKVEEVRFFENNYFQNFKIRDSAESQAVKWANEQKRAGRDARAGVLREEHQAFMGLPAVFLETLKTKLNLTPDQIKMLEQLRYEVAPASSFKHRFQKKHLVSGYSMNFKRAFAHYFFHGAKFYTQVKYADDLRLDIDNARQLAKVTTNNQEKVNIEAIANHLANHLENDVLNPRSGWAGLRGAISLWALAWVPASATLNMSQTPMITFPFLSGKFGEHKALPAMVKAMKASSFWKRESYKGTTDFELQAIDYGIKKGIITEAMAPELAGLAEGRNLINRFGRNAYQRGFSLFLEKGMLMFEYAEQFNRRIAFRAALNLALENPNAKYVREAVARRSEDYQALIAEGKLPNQAAAMVTAAEATLETQFDYSRQLQPRFFRGGWRTVFIFKNYFRSLLFMLGNNKRDVLPRFVVMSMLLGGLGGVPGGEDAKEILRVLAWWLFGKDFNLERETRKYVLDLVGDPTKAEGLSDFMLHGMARKGFHVGSVTDMISGALGGPDHLPVPTFDRSRAISSGTILPFELSKVAGPPVKNMEKRFLEQEVRAAGAAFGVGYNMYQALFASEYNWGDFKRWEKAVPRAAGNMSKAYRYAFEGMERSKHGSAVQTYDVWNDPEHAAEVVGVLAGYQPLRQSREWNRIMMTAETTAVIDLRRELLMKQMYEAAFGNFKKAENVDSVWSAIDKFNSDLPEYAKEKAITRDSIERSMQARQRSQTAQELGVPTRKSDRGISEHVRSLFPSTTVLEKVPTTARR